VSANILTFYNNFQAVSITISLKAGINSKL